jgi:hypothetical protein
METEKTTLLTSYIEEVKIDTKLDEFSLKNSQLQLPAVKHKWVARGIQNKIQIQKLLKEKSKIIKEVATKLRDEAPVKLTMIAAEKASEGHEKVMEIDNQIKECKLIEEYLEKVEKIFSSFTFDLRNVIQIIQLETL